MKQTSKQQIFFFVKYIFLGLIVFLVVAKLRACFFLPEVELPIVVYKQISLIPSSNDEISQNIFHSQISDLSVNGYQSITPARLRAYKNWGVALPENPVLINIECVDKQVIDYAASILTNYNFTATICIPEEQVDEVISGNNPSLITKEELLAYKEADVFDIGLHGKFHVKLLSELNPITKQFRKNFEQKPDVIIFSENNHDKSIEIENICSHLGAKIGISEKSDFVNTLNSKTNLRTLKHLPFIGGRLAFSIKAIRHPGALSAGNIFIAQPEGQRFKACVSVFDKDFNRLLGQNFDSLPTEPILLGKLPNKVDYPISIYITDSTGILVYKDEQFNRYTIERGNPVPRETEIPEELEKELSQIEIPLDIE